MATLVQQADNSSSSTSLTVTLSSTPTSGNMLILLVVNAGADGTGKPVSGVSGGGVTTWTKAVAINNPNGHDDEIWYGTVSNGTTTVTVTFQTTQPNNAVVSEWSGLSALDATGSDEQDTATMGSGSVTTTKANDLVIGVAVNSSGGEGLRTGNAASPAVDLTNPAPAYIGTAYLNAGVVGTYEITWTLTGAAYWEGVVAAFATSSGKTVAPSGIAGGDAFGVGRMGLGVAPSGLSASDVFGVGLFGLGVAPSGLGTTTAFGTGRFSMGVAPSGMTATDAFGTDSLILGVAPSGMNAVDAFGLAEISGGTLPSPARRGEMLGLQWLGVLR